MAEIEFEYPIKNASGKLTKTVSSRTKFGKSHSYIMRNPYKGPITPKRRKTIDDFRRANELTAAILRDAEQLAVWQERYEAFLEEYQGTPSNYKDVPKNLRGFIFKEIYRTQL
jgi:hypothetical protein